MPKCSERWTAFFGMAMEGDNTKLIMNGPSAIMFRPARFLAFTFGSVYSKFTHNEHTHTHSHTHKPKLQTGNRFPIFFCFSLGLCTPKFSPLLHSTERDSHSLRFETLYIRIIIIVYTSKCGQSANKNAIAARNVFDLYKSTNGKMVQYQKFWYSEPTGKLLIHLYTASSKV